MRQTDKAAFRFVKNLMKMLNDKMHKNLSKVTRRRIQAANIQDQYTMNIWNLQLKTLNSLMSIPARAIIQCLRRPDNNTVVSAPARAMKNEELTFSRRLRLDITIAVT